MGKTPQRNTTTQPSFAHPHVPKTNADVRCFFYSNELNQPFALQAEVCADSPFFTIFLYMQFPIQFLNVRFFVFLLFLLFESELKP